MVNIKQHLERAKTIAVVGFSTNSLKAAHTVPKYLSKFYDIIPVNPNHETVVGKKSFPDLKTLDDMLSTNGKSVDIINVFRPGKECLTIVKDILAMNNKPNLIWLQLGIKNKEAQQLAEKNRIDFIQDKCIYVVHFDLFG